jgi:hypothetical protein
MENDQKKHKVCDFAIVVLIKNSEGKILKIFKDKYTRQIYILSKFLFLYPTVYQYSCW